MIYLKWIGANAPPAQEHAKANGLECSGKSTNGDSVEGAFFGKHLRDELFVDGGLAGYSLSGVRKQRSIRSMKIEQGSYARCEASREQQAAQICRAFVTQSTGLDDQSTNGIRLNGTANKRRSPSGSRPSCLL